jgi:hypothetical protein
MSGIQYPLEGSCQCGKVSYQLLAPPLKIIACHCKACQKFSTSAFSLTALIDSKTLALQGELAEWVRIADSGNKSCAKYCPDCGIRIYHYNPDQPELIKLKPASLNDTRILEPEAHIWVSQKQAWYQIPEGVPQFSGQS